MISEKMKKQLRFFPRFCLTNLGPRQEYTALMTSIEEIQALMEAEVAGAAGWLGGQGGPKKGPKGGPKGGPNGGKNCW